MREIGYSFEEIAKGLAKLNRNSFIKKYRRKKKMKRLLHFMIIDELEKLNQYLINKGISCKIVYLDISDDFDKNLAVFIEKEEDNEIINKYLDWFKFNDYVFDPNYERNSKIKRLLEDDYLAEKIKECDPTQTVSHEEILKKLNK